MSSKCLGCPDYSSPEAVKPIIECCNTPADGEDFCEDCLNKMLGKLEDCWVDLAQQEAPAAKRSVIRQAIKRLLRY